MEQKREPVYLGIDINDRYAMISYYQLNMNEPETVSTIAGSEAFQIPTLLAKRKGLGQWYYGDDAKKMAKTSEVICIDSLLQRAVNGDTVNIEEESYEAWELLTLFLKKVMDLPKKLGTVPVCDRLILSVERLSKENMEVNHLSEDLSKFYIGNLIDDVFLQETVGTEEYEIVVANILADVIIPMAPVIPARLKQGGYFITSGIIDFKENEVKEAIEKAGLKVIEINHQGEWVNITAQKV